MMDLYQWCETCKTERNFNPEKITCLVCGTKCHNYVERVRKPSNEKK